MFYFYTNELGFQPEFMGELVVVYAIASIAGIWLYNSYLKNVRFQTIFIASIILCTLFGMTDILLVTRYNKVLGIPDKVLCLGGGLIYRVMAQLNSIPVCVLASRMCPKNIEGTMYALLMSILNLGSLLSFQFGAILMWVFGVTESNFDKLWLLILVVNLLVLLPIPLVINMEISAAQDMAENFKMDSEQQDEQSNNEFAFEKDDIFTDTDDQFIE